MKAAGVSSSTAALTYCQVIDKAFCLFHTFSNSEASSEAMNTQLRPFEVVFSNHCEERHLKNPLKASKTREKVELYWAKFLQLMGLLAQVVVIN